MPIITLKSYFKLLLEDYTYTLSHRNVFRCILRCPLRKVWLHRNISVEWLLLQQIENTRSSVPIRDCKFSKKQHLFNYYLSRFLQATVLLSPCNEKMWFKTLYYGGCYLNSIFYYYVTPIYIIFYFLEIQLLLR